MVEHVAIVSIRTHICSNKALEFRAIGTAGVFVLPKDSALLGNLDIAPLAVEVQPVDRVAGIVGREDSGDVVVAVCVVVSSWIPQRPVAGVVVYWAERKVDPGNRVIVNPKL